MNTQDLLEILKFIGPTALVAVYLKYFFDIKQKKFDQQHEHYKKIRITTANLLSVWEEFSSLEKFLKSDDPSDALVYEIPEVAKRYLKIDEEKVDRFKEAFYASLDHLKEIDVGLFHKLDGSLDFFNRTNKELLYPLLKEEIITNEVREQLLVPILTELLEELEEILLGVAEFLAKKERSQVNEILDKHKRSLAIPQESEVPQFIVNLINRAASPVHQITSTDLINFYPDPTVTWLYPKFLTGEIRKALLGNGLIGVLQMGLNLPIYKNQSSEETEAGLFPKTILLEVNITGEEDRNLVNNRKFYHLLMGVVYKITGHVPFDFKRGLVMFNKGEWSIKEMIDELKSEITTEQNQENETLPQ